MGNGWVKSLELVHPVMYLKSSGQELPDLVVEVPLPQRPDGGRIGGSSSASGDQFLDFTIDS